MKLGLVTTCMVTLGLTVPALAMDDGDFLNQAMAINLSEIAMGQLAQERGTSDGVKQYGQHLVLDHVSNGAEVITLVRDMKGTVVTQPPAADMAIFRQLMEMGDGDFDRAFAARMVEGHRKAIELFEQKASEDGRVADYAEATIPALRSHLEMAQRLAGEDQAASTNAPATERGTATAPTDQPAATADGQAVTERQRPMATAAPTLDRQPIAAPGTISAEALLGVTVHGAENEAIGEIGDVILTPDSGNGATIDAVVIDVGGFLGIGSRSVAVGFDALELRADEDGNLEAYSRYTREQLENAPEYDADTYRESRDSMRLSPGP